jgi:mRNA interferase YafQ
MSLKKNAADKRTGLPLIPDYAKGFSKDWVRLSMSGRYDMNRLKEAMLLLMANDGPLDPEWFDHPLSGDWEGHRECHIGGNFLLIYRVGNNTTRTGMIVFVRAGTHAELFG